MITISTPNYEIVTVNGKDYVIFYPQFLKDGDWATVGDENPLPVKIVELDTFNDLTKSLRETSEQNKEKLEQLNELISEMSMLSRGPKGDKGDPGPPNLEAQKDIDEHKQDKNNPHEVNKSQVGLGNVQNYGIALESQAKAGVSNAVYMTPLRTKQAIEALGVVEVSNTPYGKCVKHPDGTLEHFAFDVVMDRHISSSYKRGDVDFTIPFIDENYYVSSSIVTGLSKNPLPYTRTKGTDSVEMAVRSISTDFVEEDEVTIDLHAVGRWK